ncbi:transcriptional regulator [Candidatus Dependentiae bacterium]|nr:transcriptional regulator [Candidatus Dependentiae bacterium]
MHKNSPIAVWRMQKSVYRLEGVQCDACNALYFPRKYRCICSSMRFSPYQFSGKAQLVSFSEVVVLPIDFANQSPYCIGLVRLEEGPLILTQLADVKLGDLSAGKSMVAVFRRYFAAGHQGMIFYGVKFAPAELI